ncbi:MAG TPA: SAM-dependent methyltransferase, partial [Xanthomonadaceae bacterium]|nr:SAM-dependent methyltransferase [Xanthomonadaceae bacterium]
LGEQLDAHRKRQQAAHPNLTLTGMYNVLEKLRSGEALEPKERVIHEQGLVSVLRQIHDEIDAAVLQAYGWADLLPLLRVAHGNDAAGAGQTREDAKRAFDDAVLERLVALNAERAAEEARGLVRWLRPEFQNPAVQRAPEQAELPADSPDDDAGDEAGTAAPPAPAAKPLPWPKEPVAQVRAVAELLAASRTPLSLDEIAARFTARGPWKKRLPALLDMLAALGRATPDASGQRWGA